MNKQHVIYLLASPNGKLYIGRTCNYFSRMKNHKYMTDGCSKLNKAIKKYGWNNLDIIILEDNLTYARATARETFFINLFVSVSSGYNIRRGGVGYTPGNPMVTKRKIRALNIKTKEIIVFECIQDAAEELGVSSGHICGVLNKNVSINRHGTPVVRRQAGGYTFEEFDENAPDMTYEKIPRTMSTEAREKIGLAAKGRGAKSVIGYHVLGYTMEFDVIKDAAKQFDIDGGDIVKCAKGLRGRCGGFLWKYADDEERAKYPEWDVIRKSGVRGKPVYRIMEDGVRDEYPSAEEAARVLEYKIGSVRYSIKHNRHLHGYRWYFA